MSIRKLQMRHYCALMLEKERHAAAAGVATASNQKPALSAVLKTVRSWLMPTAGTVSIATDFHVPDLKIWTNDIERIMA